MVENQEANAGNYGPESAWSRSTWPGEEATGGSYYQPLYGSAYAYSPANETLVKRAEERVKAKRRFFRHLFIYLGVVTALWMIAIFAMLIDRQYDQAIEFVAFPLLVSVVWAISLGWHYFKTFVWESKSHQERVQEELVKLRGY